MNSVSLVLPPVLEYQHKALWCDERWAIVEGSTKCGKTYPCILWLMEKAGSATGPNQHVWWVAPIFGQAEIAFGRAVSMLTQADPNKATWDCNRSKMTVTIRGDRGRTMWFKSADNPDSLYGEDVWAAVIDEASRCPEESWHAVRSTLTATRGPARIIGNVKGRRNWAYMMARKAEAGAPNMHYAKITAKDAVEAGIIPQEEVDDARQQLPKHVFDELYNAIPSDDGGNPFGLKAIADCRKTVQPGTPVQYGIDLAKSQDWTVVYGLDNDGRLVSKHRWQAIPWSETIERIAGIVGNTHALADSTGVGDPVVEQLQRRCPQVERFVFTAQSKQRIMEGLAVGLQSGSIAYDDEVLQRELENFEYVAGRTGVRYSAPSGFHDDCVCALALAYHGLTMRPRLVYGSVDRLPAAVANKPRVATWDDEHF